jgi:hypothetical protein
MDGTSFYKVLVEPSLWFFPGLPVTKGKRVEHDQGKPRKHFQL